MQGKALKQMNKPFMVKKFWSKNLVNNILIIFYRPDPETTKTLPPKTKRISWKRRRKLTENRNTSGSISGRIPPKRAAGKRKHWKLTGRRRRGTVSHANIAARSSIPMLPIGGIEQKTTGICGWLRKGSLSARSVAKSLPGGPCMRRTCCGTGSLWRVRLVAKFVLTSLRSMPTHKGTVECFLVQYRTSTLCRTKQCTHYIHFLAYGAYLSDFFLEMKWYFCDCFGSDWALLKFWFVSNDSDKICFLPTDASQHFIDELLFYPT